MNFEEFDLDHRLLKAIEDMKYTKSTLVQQAAIPLFLQGKDILANARTGSGKTGAFAIPLIQKLLSGDMNGTRAVILVPTRELSNQVYDYFGKLITYCPLLKVVNIGKEAALSSQIQLLAENPTVIISTPARLRQHLEAKNLVLDLVETLVIDEADLMLSFGYSDDTGVILKFLPSIYQTFLASATLSADVEKLKQLVLKNPAVLKLEDKQENELVQYFIKTNEGDKYLYLLFMFKLRIHPFGSRKSMVFVNSIDKCYKVKLFLEQFGIKSCALNSELPAKSRQHIVEEFNRGVYDFIIATDEFSDVVEQVESDEETLKDEDETAKKRKKGQDADYGVSRGIDFKNVNAVINFDMPQTSRNYQHRVGRTARGVGSKGYALSFCVSENNLIVKKKGKLVMTEEQVLERIKKREKTGGRELLEFKFDSEPVERFRYRSDDALRAVSTNAIKDARIKEIKNEILHSEQLKVMDINKTHFEDNPLDLKALRHDNVVHPTKIQAHMKHVPQYLLPKSKVEVHQGDDIGYVPFKVDNGKKRTKKHKKVVGKATKRKSNPLKSFSYPNV